MERPRAPRLGRATAGEPPGAREGAARAEVPVSTGSPGLPLVAVRVRPTLFVGDAGSASANAVAKCSEMMRLTTTAFAQAGVVLAWETLRIVESATMERAASGRQSAWTEGQCTPSASWMDVFFIENTYADADAEVSPSSGRPEFHGVTLHPDPSASPPLLGWGVSVYWQVSTWTTLAHELGHAFGLPHVDTGSGSYSETIEEFRLDDYAFMPFENDTVGVGSNLMIQGTDSTSDPSDFTWTHSQVLLMRRTLASRASRWAFASSYWRSWGGAGHAPGRFRSAA